LSQDMSFWSHTRLAHKLHTHVRERGMLYYFLVLTDWLKEK
jgi:hypothetical protein